MAQKEGTADANAIVCLDGDDDVVGSIIGRQYSDHPQHQDLVVALNSKKYVSLQKKRELVLKFQPSKLDDVERYCRDPVIYKEFLRHLLDDIRRKSLNSSQISKNLTQAYTAEMLADLFVLNEWNSQLVDGQRPSRSQNDPSVMVKTAFNELGKTVGPVLVAYSDDQKKKEKKGRSKANHQVTGIRIQDTFPFDPLNDVATEPCPSTDCKHFYCLAVTTLNEVRNKQKDLDDRFDRKMTEWNAKPAASRGGKPRRQKSVCQDLACFCYRIHCSYRLDGGNCPKCRDANGDMVYTGGDGKSYCQCDLCGCGCQIKFPLHERRKVALEMEQKKLPLSSGPPNDTPSFFASVIQGSLQQGAIDALQDPSSNLDDTAMVYQNAMSLQ